MKEKNIQKRDQNKEKSVSNVMDENFIEYRDNQRITGHPLTHQY